jgi:hypothetical protein
LSKALKWSSNLDNESARWSGQPCHQPPFFKIFQSRSEDLFSCKFVNSWKPQNGLILTEIEDVRNALQVTLQQSYSNNFLPN